MRSSPYRSHEIVSETSTRSGSYDAAVAPPILRRTVAPAAADVWVRGEVYANLVESFSRTWVAGLYIVANLALGLHLFHGIWSLFQSLGWNNPRFNIWRKRLAAVLTLAVVAVNLSFPIAVQAGILEI